MVSWASVAQKAPPKSGAPPPDAIGRDEPVAVLDANAVIGGLSVQRALDRLVTIPEVLQEVRDKQSREALAALPFRVELMEPSDESLHAVTRFARATGDLHSLSTVDLRLMALARTLEVAAHGDAHLRDLPAPPRPLSRRPRRVGRGLPGWDSQGGEWAEMDALAEQEEIAAEAARNAGGNAAEGLGGGTDEVSRIAADVQALDIGSGGAQHGLTTRDHAGAVAEAGHDDATDLTGPQQSQQERRQQQQQQQQREHHAHGDPAAGQDDSGSEWTEDDGYEEEEEDEADEWQVAGKSQNSVRRQRRRARRRAAWEAVHGGSVAPSTQAVPSDEAHSSDDGGSDGDGGEGAEASPEVDAQDTPAEVDDVNHAPSETSTAIALDAGPAPSDSNISCVTADFAMQNVLLQMGLRVVAPNGLAIRRLSRHVLRCSACFLVTKEVGRLFCPRCGNATVEKVEVLTGPDGQEQYGVRRKHVLRGTRFSLPKPKGGRAAKDEPILREDILLQRMPHMRPKAVEDADPFAPEYGQDSWHMKHPTTGLQAKGAAVALAGWKHNPNERKHVRTNRRRK